MKLRIGMVGPVATTIPAPKNGSIELITSLLTDALVERGHDVTLFGIGRTQTRAKLHATFPLGYLEDPRGLWPWEMCELTNVAAACDRYRDFDLLHCQAAYFPMSVMFSKLVPIPMLHTVHYQPDESHVAMWRNYPDAHYAAISSYQASVMSGLHDVSVVPHGLDTRNFPDRNTPSDYVVFLGRFTPGKGPLQAIEVAKRCGLRLVLAAPENEYYREAIAPHVDGERVRFAGELDFQGKTQLLASARALLYPVQQGEPFGLVLVEAMACGTPVAALDKGAVAEIVRDGIGGCVFPTLDALVTGLPRVFELDRAGVRAHARAHFDVQAMAAGYERLYERLVRAGRA
jgi:glycosyltransferase involved in cell wall biosynthesis